MNQHAGPEVIMTAGLRSRGSAPERPGPGDRHRLVSFARTVVPNIRISSSEGASERCGASRASHRHCVFSRLAQLFATRSASLTEPSRNTHSARARTPSATERRRDNRRLVEGRQSRCEPAQQFRACRSFGAGPFAFKLTGSSRTAPSCLRPHARVYDSET